MILKGALMYRHECGMYVNFMFLEAIKLIEFFDVR